MHFELFPRWSLLYVVDTNMSFNGHALRLIAIMLEFQSWCDLLLVHGAIDCIQLDINKPPHFADDLYYKKSASYTMVAHGIVDCQKMFTNVFVEF